jgi:Glycosyltransferase sugar-binding region containing DXD motif
LEELSPATRVLALQPVVLDNPDSTAAATALMIALRQAGAMARPEPVTLPGGGQVTKSVMQFWDAEVPPPDVLALMKGWQDHNPDYTCRIFNDKTAQAFLTQTYPPAVLQAYRHSMEAAQRADIFRLAWLAAAGGVYVDADDRCLAPLGTIIPDNAELVLYQEDISSMGNNFIAVRPRHPVILRALQLAVQAINRGDSDIVWLSTGPGLLTRVLAVHLATVVPGEVALPEGIIVFDRRDIYHSIAMNCTLGYKKSNRHWVNSSFKGRTDREAAPAGAEGKS